MKEIIESKKTTVISTSSMHRISNPFFRVGNLLTYSRFLTFVRNDKILSIFLNKTLILTLFLFFVSCQFFEESSEKKYAHLYVDILIAEETHKTDVDSMQIVLDSLYMFYNISESNYLLELEKFSYSKETWDAFFELTEEYLDTLKAIEKRERK